MRLGRGVGTRPGRDVGTRLGKGVGMRLGRLHHAAADKKLEKVH